MSEINEAAVEAGVAGVQERIAWASPHWGPVRKVDASAWPRIVRAALTAALPHLTPEPRSQHGQGRPTPILAERDALRTAVERLRLDLEEARADRDTAVSASEEEVAEALDPAAWGCHDGCTLCRVARESSLRKASALLARFNLTSKEESR